MKSILLEEGSNGRKAYESLVLDPKSLGILSNELSLKIVREIAKNPGCALDIARSLGEHEQKIYYHLRKLESSGMVRLLRSEKRFGMTAKIYDAVSPVVSAKLYDSGSAFRNPSEARDTAKRIRLSRFFHPFIEDGKLNAKIVMGYPYPHGKHDAASSDGAHSFDLALLLGNLVTDIQTSSYKFDVDVKKEDLKGNLILLGNAKNNTVICKLNDSLPVKFNLEEGNLCSVATSKRYSEPWIGVVAKMDNPFAKGKKILLLGGMRTRGIRAAVLALTQNFDSMLADAGQGNVTCIVEGLDRSGNKIIDSIRILE